MLGDTAGRTLKTTRTSVRILELVLDNDGLTLADLDGMLDKPKSSLHSHLKTLEECRYLVQEGDTYSVSYRVALLGERVERGRRTANVAEDVVDDLAERTGEEANFTLLEHGRLLMVYGTSGRSTAGENDVGFRTEYYLHNTAAGKAILADLEPERVERIVAEWGLPRETEATITDREELFESLAEVADRGYGIVDEEFAPGLVAVGVPVHDAEGRVVGGLSVGGPKYRIDTSRLHRDLVDHLLDAVEEFENGLQA